MAFQAWGIEEPLNFPMACVALSRVLRALPRGLTKTCTSRLTGLPWGPMF